MVIAVNGNAAVGLSRGAIRSLLMLDKLVTRFGMPMGPVTLADMVGLDVAKLAGGVLAEAYSDRAQPP